MTRIRIALGAAVIGCGALIAFGAGAVGAKTSVTGHSDSGTAYLSINRQVGSVLYASATSTDKLLGAGAIAAQYTLTPAKGGGLTLSSKHTVLYTATGSLTGTSSAHVTISGNTETISNGKLDLAKGAGSQAGHSLVGTFTRSGDATANQFTLHYTGTYN